MSMTLCFVCALPLVVEVDVIASILYLMFMILCVVLLCSFVVLFISFLFVCKGGLQVIFACLHMCLPACRCAFVVPTLIPELMFRILTIFKNVTVSLVSCDRVYFFSHFRGRIPSRSAAGQGR